MTICNGFAPNISNNRQDVSVHEFAPVKTCFVRLWIDKAEPNGNTYARIHEFEVYSRLAQGEVLLGAHLNPLKLGKKDGAEEVLVNLEMLPAKTLSPPTTTNLGSP